MSETPPTIAEIRTIIAAFAAESRAAHERFTADMATLKARHDEAMARMGDLQKMIKANSADIAELRQQAAETRAANAETNKVLAETRVDLTETRKILTKTVKGLEKSNEMLDKLTLDYGNRANDEGFAFERAVWRTLDNNKTIGGIKLDEVIFNAPAGKDKFQYDIVCLNGNKTVVVETKLTLSKEHVETFAKSRLPHFAKLLPNYAKGKKVIGAMVYQRTDPKGAAVAAALARGLLVLQADNQKHLHQIKTPADIKERP